MKQDIRQYKGPLNASEVASGMNAARRNASRLAKDARLLLNSQSYASAIAMAILSIEESGKNRILRSLALARNECELKECWREYRSHTKKNMLWPILDSFSKGARRAAEFAPLLDPGADHPYVLDKLKQISLYTDCFRRGHWSVPTDVVTEELANGLLQIAETFCNEREVTTVEIDLWMFYLGPCWKVSTPLMEEALFEWDKEMRRRGLHHDKGDSTIETFFREGLHPKARATPKL
jgi:AbiV family abortive infection protein